MHISLSSRARAFRSGWLRVCITYYVSGGTCCTGRQGSQLVAGSCIRCPSWPVTVIGRNSTGKFATASPRRRRSSDEPRAAPGRQASESTWPLWAVPPSLPGGEHCASDANGK